MKFKRRLLITMLAAAQVSMAVPVSAHTQAGSISSQEMPELGTEVLNMEQTEVQMQDPMAADDAANSISDTLILEDTDIEEEPFGVETKEVQEQEAVQQGKSEPVIQAEAEPAELPSDKTAVTGNVTDELILLMNSPVMYHNGQMYKAAQPMAVKSGVSYVSIRALVEHAGLKLSYDNKTKETIIFKNGSEIRFTTDSSKYKVNGEQRPMKGPAYQYKNTFMVPLTSITQALGIPYTVNQPEKKVILNLSGMTARDGESPESHADTPVPNEPGLILMMNSNKMYHNGTLYTAAQPMAVKSGVSYVAIRSLVDRTGLKLSYDSSTKETVIRRGSDELRFKTDSSIYTVNGVKKTMKGPAYQYKNTFMVPLTSITQALDIPYTVDQPNKRVILTLITKQVASFTILNSEIFAGQTVVQYKSNAYSPAGLPIVDERWEGREEIYNVPGVHTVTYSVQDSSGEWSDPYSVTIQVLVPSEPPQAMFTTDKEQYKMGEKITYTDLSTDDESAIVKRDWDNNAKAFFTPGPVTIGLTVTDKHGLTDYYEKTVIITGETLYTREEFYQLFADLGERYVMDGSSVPSMPQVNYTRTSEPRMLIRSNSPETVYSEGIVYRETGIGSTRFMIHHLNATGKTMKMYVVATNFNSIPVNLTT